MSCPLPLVWGPFFEHKYYYVDIMKSLNSILLAVLCLFCISCSNDIFINKIGKRVVSEPKETAHIISPIDSIKNNCLEGVVIISSCVDSVIIACLDESSAGYSFRAIDTRTLEYVDFLAIGRGPNEIISGQFSAKRNESGAKIIDITAFNEHYIVSVDLEKTMREKRLVVCDTTKLLPTARSSYIVGDQVLSKVIFDEDGPYYSLKLYSKDNQSVTKTDYIFGKDRFVAYNDYLYSSINRIKPDGSRLFMGMFSFDEIQIYDIL